MRYLLISTGVVDDFPSASVVYCSCVDDSVEKGMFTNRGKHTIGALDITDT